MAACDEAGNEGHNTKTKTLYLQKNDGYGFHQYHPTS
jgi:hypothetical protein